MGGEFRTAIVCIVLLLAGAACGSDDESTSGAGTGGASGGGGSGGGISGGAAGLGSGGMPAVTSGTCSDTPPPGAEQAPDPPSYSGGACPTLTPGRDYNLIMSSGIERQFVLAVPENPEPGETFPVAFMWHWLSGDGQQFFDIAGGQQAANEARAILVLPTGVGAVPANWPWSTLSQPEEQPRDLLFFDDLLACVSEQFPVNKNCVSSVGVSDGALWTSQLAGLRGQYLSSILVLSGGVNTDLVLPWTPAPHKMPALALWGGMSDVCIVLEFDPAMRNLEAELTRGGHFVVECIHDCGHAVPPLEPAPGESLFAPLWSFVTEHPYWLPDGESPYIQNGLPAGMPEWCAIGVGNATPRDTGGQGCGALGC